VDIDLGFFTKIKLKLNLLILISLTLFSFSIVNLYSQSSDGGYAQSYLFRNVGARAISMGGAYTAVVNDPSSIYFNPAGLGFLNDDPIIQSTITNLSLNRTQSNLMYGQKLSDEFGIGFGINTLTSGTFTARDIQGNPVGQLNDLQYNLALSMAYKNDVVSFGSTIKYLKNNLQGSNIFGTGFALDLGTKINVADLFSFGVAVQNLSGMMFWNTELVNKEIIPYSVRTGIAMEFGLNEEEITSRNSVDGEIETYIVPASRYILLSMDAVLNQFENSPRLNMGVEIVPIEFLALRGGLSLYGENDGKPQILPMNNWGSGLSIRPNIKNLPFRLNIDYSVANEFLSNSGISHSLGLIFEF